LTPAEAVALQKTLATRIELTDRLGEIRHIAGVDVGFEGGGTVTRAAVAVLDAGSLQLVDYAIARRPTEFPYIPGLLSFREIPAILDALAGLETRPDLLLVDGQGVAHPRRIGIASHLGLLADLPSIGVGKSRLTGRHGPVPEGRGEWTPLEDKGETIGAVLRSRAGVAPLYISPGHRICLETALSWVMRTLTRYRLPETTRWAHRLASGPALPPKKQASTGLLF
jgi:deoxyribonuclease V